MPADPRLSASRPPRASANYAQPPMMPPQQQSSPWVPFSIALVLILAVAGGLFFYMDMQFKNLEGKLLKTNDFVIKMDERLKKIEDNISQSDAQAQAEGSSLTSRLMSLENRVTKANKDIQWNNSRIEKQESATEEVKSSVSSVSSSVQAQNSKISANTSEIEALKANSGPNPDVANLTAKVEANAQAIETIDAHRSRMSSAIQQIQSDVARLIRLYEKDNPTAKRVQ